MEPEVRHIAKTDYSKHRIVRSDGEVTIDGVYPEREPGFYMVRVRVPGGVVTIAQAKALAEFAYAYANGEWHVDTRANVEFHGVSEAKLLPFIEALEPVGLSTRGACGDSVRNIVTGSETASASIERIQAVVDRLTRMFAGNPAFETLPRKFKIAFYAADDRTCRRRKCRAWSPRPSTCTTSKAIARTARARGSNSYWKNWGCSACAT
jgi:sulfite reductase beta subunit-like hemoprotein